MKTVLFACVHNAGRSQMAAGWFNALSDPAKARAVSAGTAPAARVHGEVAEAMKEIGIDLSEARPQLLSNELARSATLLVTMGCGEACPAASGLRRADWPLEDPKGRPLARVREIRDEIRARVTELLAEEGWGPMARAAYEPMPAASGDLPAVIALLERCELSTSGVSENLARFVVARTNDGVAGVVGVEAYGTAGLLRSLAVEPERRREGIATALVERVTLRAAREGVTDLHLLTTTARAYFERIGFASCPRLDAPPGIRDSWEFRTGCPSSAVFMRRNIDGRKVDPAR